MQVMQLARRSHLAFPRMIARFGQVTVSRLSLGSAKLHPRSGAAFRLECSIQPKEDAMKGRTALALSTIALLYMTSSAAVAQNAAPTYQGDPDVYKVIF